MKRPESVKIGWVLFSINWQEKGEWLASGKDIDLTGQCDVNTLSIDIQVTDYEQVMREVLLHEILHGVYATTSLSEYTRAPLDKYGLNADDEEYVVRHMSGPLLDVLQVNPKVMAYLIP